VAVESYADSSFLVSLYRKDDNQDAAKNFIARTRVVVSFSPLNRIELRNALRNAQSFGQITEEDRRAAFRQIENDFDAGLLAHVAVDWTNVLRRADELSEEQAGREGQRTIDLLHVAIALESGAKMFLSFDNRQRKLAQAAGLRVKP
jgi:predicted nucleic acid-binding protein